jgi:formylmethanofuran dehydrogenase subunit E-like metal-binding protein
MAEKLKVGKAINISFNREYYARSDCKTQRAVIGYSESFCIFLMIAHLAW